MGSDREFFSDSKNGFQDWKTEKPVLLPGESSRCSTIVNIPFPGRYYIQFRCDGVLEVKLGDVQYKGGCIPMLHNEEREFPVTLEKGRNVLTVCLSNPSSKELPSRFSARILDEEGNILFP